MKQDSADAIIVSGLTKYYDDVLAVDGIDFQVKGGELFGFLGPNGAGKTTTIRMLTGLSQPSAGIAQVLGHDIETGITVAKKEFGVVPEVSNLYDELTALENLIFVAQLYGIPRNQRIKRAEELLKTFGLFDKKKARFSTLSRGMKRAVTIAAALIHRPRLLFLDEPTVGLDAVTARSLRSLIQELNHQGVTIFLTTHYLEEADLLCDRIALLVHGRIVALDTPDKLKQIVKLEPACEVHFDHISEEIVKDLEKQKGIRRVESSGHNLLLYGESMPSLVESILRYGSQKGLQIVFISSVKPSLEDAFIQITGMNVEVMLAEKGGW
jgi:ABC-2 type transport system ATP-binding protein